MEGMPEYMTGLASFQVRNLTGAYAPTGSVTMYDTLPSEWRTTGQPFGADNVFAAWSGGAGDSAGRRMFVHGGGHADSGNNGVYVYDFSGTTRPAGWKLAANSLSSVSAADAGYKAGSATVYPDNRPSAIHSYDGLWFDAASNRLYRASGSSFTSGGYSSSGVYYFDFGGSQWSSVDAGGAAFATVGGSLGSTLIGSPDGSKLLFLPGSAGPRFISANGGVTASGSTPYGSEEVGPACAYDSVNGRWLSVGRHWSSGPHVRTIAVDWSTNTFTVTARSHSSHSLIQSHGASVVYDALLQCFWIFCMRDVPSSRILRMDANTFAITEYALGGDSISMTGSRGSYNKHVWFPEWRIIGTCQVYNAPASLLKLPSV
jgi:hypothetical protein